MLAAGESNKEIGRALNISTGTVKAHLESLYRRLEVKNRTQCGNDVKYLLLKRIILQPAGS